jgi:hypothetical protein
MNVGEWSFLLWVMAAVVALFSAHLFVAWVRRAQGYAQLRDVVGPALVAAAALGTGINASMVLALGAEGLSFPLGYRWITLPVLWLGAMLACLPAAWWLTRRHGWLALMGSGLLLAAVAMGVQLGWLHGAGFRPGLRWNWGLVGGAGAIAVFGFIASLWMAYSDSSGLGARRTLWRLGASVLMVMTIVAGQEVMLSAGGLHSQVGSIFQRELRSVWLALGAGAAVPTVLALMVLDVVLRNHGDRNRGRRSPTGVELELPKRRKRRRKYRTL